MFGGPQASRAPATPAAGGPHPSQTPDTPAAGAPQPSRALPRPAEVPQPSVKFAKFLTEIIETRRGAEEEELDACAAMSTLNAEALDYEATDNSDMSNYPSATEAEDEEGPQLPPPMPTTATANTHGGGERPPGDADNDNSGSYSFYVANWGGHRQEQGLREHINCDVISRNPCSIIVAAEVNDKFIHSLLDPSQCELARSSPLPVRGQDEPAVAGKGANYVDRRADLSAWHVATSRNFGTANRGNGALVIAAKSTLATGCTLLQKEIMRHADHKNKKGGCNKAYSRMLCAEVHWRKRMAGQTSVRVINVHMYRSVAKQETDAQIS